MSKFMSIAIPTRNRAEYLRLSIESIIGQDFFRKSDDIEVVVSDNNSEDNTESIMTEYIKKYPGKIKYFKNQTDISDYNFEKSIRSCEGEYIKIANDTLIWRAGSVENIYQNLIVSMSYKPLFFISNGFCEGYPSVIFSESIEGFLSALLYQITWIGGFGIWRDHLDKIDNLSEDAQLKLPQVSVILKILDCGVPAFILNTCYFDVQEASGKDYSLSTVFGKNFISILKRYSKSISKNLLGKVKEKTLKELILKYHYDPRHNFGSYSLDEGLEDYVTEPYYLESLRIASKIAERQWKNQDLELLQKIWRENNLHNETYITTKFNLMKVKVGRSTYGPLTVWDFGSSNERLQIGHYVSIAQGVEFLLGGEHYMMGLSTFPVKAKLYDYPEAISKGPIVIQDDVWIGHNAIILSGVTIGQGAIIGASSVIASDVPPYSIFAGNPGRFIKFRFNEEVRVLLEKIDFSKLSLQQMGSFMLDLNLNYKELDCDDICDWLPRKL